MYWPNEPAHMYPEFTQAGGRAAFAAMVEDGTIDALEIYSFLVERTRFPDTSSFEQAAIDAVARFAPDIIFVQHVGGSGLSSNFWPRLRSEVPKATLAYHEGDVFGRLFKRLDRDARNALAHADIVFSCARGSIADLYRSYTRALIEYQPHSFARGIFARHDPAAATKTCDVVMIGSSGRSRKLPFLYMPGGRKRARFAAHLSEIYGARFALYGHGWPHLSSARGAVPFFEQEAAIQSARISANWDHFDEIGWYFSDRLPISLAAGVPHVTTWHEGYDELFADCPGLYPCRSVSEALDMCARLLDRSDAEMLDEGLAAKDWAMANMEANVVFARSLKRTIALHRERIRE